MAAQRCSRAVLLLGLLAAAWAPLHAAAEASIHTVITTECSPYFSWQSLGMFYSHRKSGQPGPITRIMCCTKEEYDRLPEADRDLVPTHVAPSYTRHPRNGDVYSAYNKPVAIIDWLAKNDIKEEYVLVIDADMIMREPFTAEDVGAKPGRAVAAYFGYMKGVKNALAMKHVPDVVPRNDTMAGPRGRRGDQVGGFTLMHREDLRRVAPLWLKFTEDVRFDPDAWELSGDAYSTHKGDRPWISEMYGYSYGCAKADVWHLVHHTAMLYPGYDVSEPPKVLHYGLLWDVPSTGYSFDKHWHYDFNPLVCPPWDVGTDPRRSKKGIFAHPPNPRSFLERGEKGTTLLRSLMSIEVLVTLNAAFCERHRKVCPPSDELERECGRAEALMKEYEEVYGGLLGQLPDPCHDIDERCKRWAADGECERNQGFMFDSCMLSCKLCTPRKARSQAPDIEHKDGVARTEGAAKAADAVGAAHREHEQRAQAINAANANMLRKNRANQVDSAARLRGGAGGGAGAGAGGQQAAGGGGGGAGAAANQRALRLKCTGHQDWSMEQVKECLRLAAQGMPYDPAHVKRATTGAGAGAGAGGEQGQRREQQLHEDDAVLQQQAAADEEGAGAGGRRVDDGLDEGRLLGEAAAGGTGAGVAGRGRKAVKRIEVGQEVGPPVGLTRLGLFGVLLWAGTLLLAFFLLPWARRYVRVATAFIPSGAGPSPGYKQKAARSD